VRIAEALLTRTTSAMSLVNADRLI